MTLYRLVEKEKPPRILLRAFDWWIASGRLVPVETETTWVCKATSPSVMDCQWGIHEEKGWGCGEYLIVGKHE